MISGFLSGINAYIRGSEYYSRPFFFKYLLISGAISLFFFLLLTSVIFAWGDNLGMAVVSGISGQSVISDVVEKIVRVLSVIALWVLVLFIFKYIILIIVAPVMSVLSEKIEAEITGRPVDQDLSIKNQLYLVARGARIAISNLSRELFLTLVLLLVGLFPGAAVITTPLIFIVQSYYAGFGNLDLFMERHFNRRQSRSFVSRHKGVAIANGGVFLGLLLIPFVGAFVAPALATVAATISGNDLLEKNESFY